MMLFKQPLARKSRDFMAIPSAIKMLFVELNNNQSIKEGLASQEKAEELLDEYKFTEASSISKEAYFASNKAFGPEHTYTADALSKSAVIFNILGHYDTALEHAILANNILQNLQQIKENKFKHPLLARTLSILSESYAYKGFYDLALKNAKEALTMSEEMFGKSNIQALNAKIDLGDRYRLVGELQTAEDILTECEAIYDCDLQYLDARRTSAHIPLLELYIDKCDYSKALHFLEKEHCDIAKLQVKKNPFWGKFYNLKGSLESKMEDFESAKNSFDNAREFYFNVFGGSHPELSFSLTGLANCKLQQGEFKNTMQYQLEAIEMFQKFVADNTHPYYFIMNLHLALIMRNSPQKLPGAQLLVEANLKGLSQRLGPLHYKTKYYENLVYNI